VGNVVTNLHAKSDDDRLWNEKALVLITTRRTTRGTTFLALGDPFPGLKNRRLPKWQRLMLSFARHFKGRLTNTRRSRRYTRRGWVTNRNGRRVPNAMKSAKSCQLNRWRDLSVVARLSLDRCITSTPGGHRPSPRFLTTPPAPLACPFFADDGCQNWPAKNSTNLRARRLRLPSSTSRSWAEHALLVRVK